MSVYTFVSFLTESFCRKILAGGDLLLKVDMEVLTGLALLALPVEPVDADCPLPLGLINALILGFNYG